MEENEFETLKRKKIRKLLLLKINDELKEITKYKSNIRINSKTIKELNEVYNKNDILLFEKSTVYYNYIKTEETIISNNVSSINIVKEISRPVSKSVNKINSKIEDKNINKNKEKSVNKSKALNNTDKLDFNSIDEDSGSQIMSFFPKKIELGRKKFLDYNKPKHRHNESIQNNSKKYININKETVNEHKLNKSTKFSNTDIHLYKLIEKIKSIKNNESSEGIIKQNIKKLRHYCYQLRKKKKIKKVSINKNNNATTNNSSRKKIKYKDKKIFRNPEKKRSSMLNKDVVEKSLFLIKQKLEGNNNPNRLNLNIRNETSPSLSPRFNIKVRKKSTAKVIKLNPNYKYKINIIPPVKTQQKNHSTLKNKEKVKKLKSVNELVENKFINKLKKKKKKSLNYEEKTNITTDENIPSINQIPKNAMRSTVNEIRMKFDDDSGGNKLKYNKVKFNHKKSLNKNNLNLNITTNNDNDSKFHYFNGLVNKKDKIELHDNLGQNKSLKKTKRNEQKKKEIALKNEENDDEEIIKLKKLSIVIDSRKKSKKKIFDSPDRRVYRYSNFSNYNRNAANNSNKNNNDKINRTFAKRNKIAKE